MNFYYIYNYNLHIRIPIGGAPIPSFHEEVQRKDFLRLCLLEMASLLRVLGTERVRFILLCHNNAMARSLGDGLESAWDLGNRCQFTPANGAVFLFTLSRFLNDLLGAISTQTDMSTRYNNVIGLSFKADNAGC